MKSYIPSTGKIAGIFMQASFLVVLSFSSCSKDDETVNPAVNAPASSSAKSAEPVLANAAGSESPFYPAMPAGSLIYLARTACKGGCPVYAVSVSADGAVRYTGYANVGTMGSYTFNAGRETVKRLADRMVSTGFLNFKDRYPYAAGESMMVTGLNMGRTTPKVVLDYGVKVPTALVELRTELEKSLGIDKLVRVNPAAMESPNLDKQ